MRKPGYFATFRGTDYEVHILGRTWVEIRPDAVRGDLRRDFRGAIEYGSDDGRPWLRLPEDALDRYYSVRVNATWYGEPVWVEGIGDDGLIGIGYLGSSDFARTHGLRGQEREGFFGEVPEAELSEIRVTEKDLL